MLKFENFTINLESRHLFTIHNMVIGSGEMVNIAGNNATGKTLLLKSIHGEYSKYLGSVMIKENNPIFSRKKRETLMLEITPHILHTESVWKNLVLPLTKITPRVRQKLTELCEIANLNDKISRKSETLSYSEIKYLELIRAVIQLPKLILIDDLDNFFDELHHTKALKILEYAKNSGTCVIVTSKKKMEGFDENYRIYGMKMVKI